MRAFSNWGEGDSVCKWQNVSGVRSSFAKSEAIHRPSWPGTYVQDRCNKIAESKSRLEDYAN